MQVQRMMMVSALALVPMTASWAAEAPCCASGDNGRPASVMARSLTDLGQTNPTVANESQRPDYQAFVFTRDGRRFVEMADASGTPRAAFAVVHGGLITLPVGADVVQQVPFAPAATDVVYEDETLVVGIRRSADSGTTWQVYVR